MDQALIAEGIALTGPRGDAAAGRRVHAPGRDRGRPMTARAHTPTIVTRLAADPGASTGCWSRSPPTWSSRSTRSWSPGRLADGPSAGLAVLDTVDEADWPVTTVSTPCAHLLEMAGDTHRRARALRAAAGRTTSLPSSTTWRSRPRASTTSRAEVRAVIDLRRRARGVRLNAALSCRRSSSAEPRAGEVLVRLERLRRLPPDLLPRRAPIPPATPRRFSGTRAPASSSRLARTSRRSRPATTSSHCSRRSAASACTAAATERTCASPSASSRTRATCRTGRRGSRGMANRSVTSWGRRRSPSTR